MLMAHYDVEQYGTIYEVILTASWVNVSLMLADDEQHVSYKVSVHGRKDTWELISTTTTACSSQFPHSTGIYFKQTCLVELL